MKKRNAVSVILIIIAVILICFIALVLLKKNPGSSDEADETGDAPEAETITDGTLSEYFTAFDGSENLLVYEGDALDDMSYPEFIICESGILFYDTDYSESDENYVCFYIFDPESGQITAQNSFECEFLTDIKQTDEGIVFADSSVGYVMIADENLEPVEKWEFEGNYEYWYLTEDGSGLYMIDDNTLCLIDIESGTCKEVLSSSVSLYGSAPLNGGACINYVDDDQMSLCVWLDFETGNLISPSYEEPADEISLYDDLWLISPAGSYYEYIFGYDDNLLVAGLEEGSLSLMEDSSYLLYFSDDNSPALYDTDGSFVSECFVSGDTVWFYSDCCLFSEQYGGIFIIAYSDEGPMLLFWDIGAECEGEDLSTVPLSEYTQAVQGESADASLYERARQLGEEYGVEILIADQCDTAYDDFTAEQVSDYSLITYGLDILESALSSYPENFISQLKYDKITKIQINLMGTLTPVNSNWGQEGYNGFTQESKNANIMVLDLNELYEDTVYHEMSHIIDKKLEWDSYCRSDALYSEDLWQDLNPEGFEYTYVYEGFTETVFEGDEYLYFTDTYSMVSPTEDRARIMEYAMAGYDSYFTDYEPLAAKLSYYCECIRDAFDTAGWPDAAPWEEPLN